MAQGDFTMTVTTIATVKTTVHLDWTTAPKVRMTAKIDMPEYGLVAGQTFYLVRSSENTGLYYILTWNYVDIKWTCPCKHSVSRPTARPCRHRRLVSDDCKERREARKAQSEALHEQIDTFLANKRKDPHMTDIERKLTAAGLMRK
jgi:hypothetical protein